MNNKAFKIEIEATVFNYKLHVHEYSIVEKRLHGSDKASIYMWQCKYKSTATSMHFITHNFLKTKYFKTSHINYSKMTEGC